jgi:hypothetical protein
MRYHAIPRIRVPDQLEDCRVNYHALKCCGFLLHPSSTFSSWFYASGQFRSTGNIFYGLASVPAEVPEVFLPGYPTTTW